MKPSSFDKLLNISKDIENITHGEQCGVFGNNVNAPIDNDISEYNKGASFMTYGNYSVPLNESIEYVFDINFLKDKMHIIKNDLKKRLTELNNEAEKNKTVDPRSSSTAGFLKSIGADKFPNLLDEIELEEQGIVPKIYDIPIDNEFSDVLSKLYTPYFDNTDDLNKFKKSAIGVIKEYDLKTWGEFIDKVESLANNKYNFQDELKEKRATHDQQLDKFTYSVFDYLFKTYSDDELEQNIEKLAEKVSGDIYTKLNWNRTNISLNELMDRVRSEITLGGRDIPTLKHLYK